MQCVTYTLMALQESEKKRFGVLFWDDKTYSEVPVSNIIGYKEKKPKVGQRREGNWTDIQA